MRERLRERASGAVAACLARDDAPPEMLDGAAEAVATLREYGDGVEDMQYADKLFKMLTDKDPAHFGKPVPRS